MAKLYVSINTVAHNFGDLNHHWALDGTATLRTLVTTTCISRDGRSLTCGHTRCYFSYPHAQGAIRKGAVPNALGFR